MPDPVTSRVPVGGPAGPGNAGGGDREASPAGEPGSQAPTVASIVERLTGIEAALTDFHRRAAHREAVIDRLHEERLEQRSGIRRALLDPVVTDLIRLYDGLAAEARRMSGSGDSRLANLLASFADDVELALERCGLDLIRPQTGDRFQSGGHLAAAVAPTGDPALHNTVAEVTQAGVLERETGRVRRPARIRVYRSIPPGPGDEGVPASPPSPATSPSGAM